MFAGQPSTLIETLRCGLSSSTYSTPDKATLRKAAHSLAELCKQDEFIDEVVAEGAIEVVVPLLNSGGTSAREQQPDDGGASTSGASLQEELDKELCFILGLLAVKPEYQTRIAQSGALSGLVRLLKEHKLTTITKPQPGSGGVARRAADAITNLAHENVEIKNMVREQDGIPPLVGLLEAMDVKVQRAACGALRTLAFKNEQNKNVIVEHGALPTLIQLLRSEDSGVHYEAVGVIGNLVHSSQHVKLKVLEEGALQPVINLLNSDCPDSQRESALLLGQFATADPDTKAKIVQRGAVPSLVRMLAMPDVSLKEMAAFALGRLAQNVDNQAGIVQLGGLPPLLELLESKHYNLQHNAAFALYGLAENEDNIPDLIREGALQRLEDCKEKLQVQASKDCVQKTINRLEQKLKPDPSTGPNLAAARRALQSMVFLLRSSTKAVQQRAAMSLARLAPDEQLKPIFVDKRGIDVLLDMLMDPNVSHRSHREAAAALLQLTKKLDAHLPAVVDQQPQQPGRAERSVYLGSEYVNNPTLADITFNVEGRRFYAHRIALLASSEAFRAMFSGGYREKDADSVDIPNISWSVFEAMMRFVYTGQLDVTPDIAFELLQASDQYLLEGLKRLCENAIAQSLTTDSVMSTFEYSEQFSAPQLGRRCLLFVLEHYDDVFKLYDNTKDRPFYFDCLRRMVPCLKDSLYCGAGPIWDQSTSSTAAGAAAGSGGGASGAGGAPPVPPEGAQPQPGPVPSSGGPRAGNRGGSGM
ncbi:ARM REPEAT PROTEIN INTERACTING WITH ABF2 [Tetrabaena socialis]|uniref:ARM REPEAT PROTEIN INTERACTING WITH ABF2 n=1 Tax=Tetrabaena socialis TaxID=47790 RepID=A0A2J8ADG2_9CHLO|nr:ARM REPEAT PROTEIN INTERACTING WITH ABF2 [Tetrabaena socialis]|eukprot:PNH10561.1 ARM REPEAT PROTEIN INTERACTING WITH ABF2 [Tetrabaena socialis]